MVAEGEILRGSDSVKIQSKVFSCISSCLYEGLYDCASSLNSRKPPKQYNSFSNQRAYPV